MEAHGSDEDQSVPLRSDVTAEHTSRHFHSLDTGQCDIQLASALHDPIVNSLHCTVPYCSTNTFRGLSMYGTSTALHCRCTVTYVSSSTVAHTRLRPLDASSSGNNLVNQNVRTYLVYKCFWGKYIRYICQ